MPSPLEHVETEIELCRSACAPRAGGTSRRSTRLFRRVVQLEHDLEERIAAEIAVRLQLLDQLLERKVLVRVRRNVVSRTRVMISANDGLPARLVRITSVLTKNPMSLSYVDQHLMVLRRARQNWIQSRNVDLSCLLPTAICLLSVETGCATIVVRFARP